MSESVTVSLSAGQVAEFRALAQQEEQAKQIPIARTYAARGIVLQSYSPEQIKGQSLHIDIDAGTISVSLNGPMAVE
jgi:hypothetical protein